MFWVALHRGIRELLAPRIALCGTLPASKETDSLAVKRIKAVRAAVYNFTAKAVERALERAVGNKFWLVVPPEDLFKHY